MAKSAVFVDTAGWLALVNRRDQLHEQAQAAYRSIGNAMRLTTDAVFIETCNALSKSATRGLAVSFMSKIGEAETLGILKVIHVSKKLLNEGWQLYVERVDKEWSLTDCISFVVMRVKGCQSVLTADHHFRQAGFQPLLTVSSSET